MLRLTLLHARPGMVLAMPIVHPTCPEVILLRAGASLDEKSIERLRGIGIREAWIRYPSLDHLTAFVSPQVHDACRSLTATVGRALDGVLADSHARLDFYAYKKAVLGLIEKLVAKPSAAIFVSELVAGDKPMLRHASNVCVLSILMGLKLDFYLVRERARVSSAIARDLSGLGVGAMLHDVGLLRLSDETLERFRATRDESDPAWREHVTLGFDMVKGELDPTAAAAVLHHHQRYDGSGFPRRVDLHGVSLPISGSEIHVFARIVACADLFDRLRHPAHVPGDDETLLPSIPAVRALRLLREAPLRSWVDPIIFRALLAVMPPFAPGSVVRITGGCKAVVVDWSPLDPCRPVVEVISGPDGVIFDDDEPRARIDLRQSREISIIEAEGHDVSGDIFTPVTPHEFDLHRVSASLSNRAEELTRNARRNKAVA